MAKLVANLALVVVIVVFFYALSCCPPGGSMMRAAWRAEERNEVKNIRTSIEMFYLEYGVLPVSGPGGVDFTVEVSGQILEVLSGESRVGLNPREKVFYEGKMARDGREGIQIDPATGDRELLDPWGRRYVVMFDGDGDGLVQPPEASNPIAEKWVVFGGGEDPGDIGDDPKSWE